MIRDLLRLDTDKVLFLRQTMGDMEFISSILDVLTEKFIANIKFLDREVEGDNLSDIEWQFSQLLNEISNSSCPFSPANFPETRSWLDKFRKDSIKRQKQINESYVPMEHSMSEPVVSHAELNGLLGSA
jgi:hypothetical protein